MKTRTSSRDSLYSTTRRAFLGDVGRGMIIASVGAAIADQLGFSTAFAEKTEGSGRLTFGRLEPLATAMLEMSPDKLQETMVSRLKRGQVSLKDLTAAGALANARTFGGEDYDGYHCMFALMPALEMSAEMPKGAAPLPVLKVLYRNAARMQHVRRQNPSDKLLPSGKAKVPTDVPAGELLRQATRARDIQRGERILGTLSSRSALEAFNALQYAVQDRTNVHGVALAHRAWEMVELIGEDHAHTLLRQSVHFTCTHAYRKGGHADQNLQKVLGESLEKLDGKSPGTRKADDAQVLELTHTIFHSNRNEAAAAVAEALLEGMSPEVVGEAITLAANELILRQVKNRCHGDSRGVHASDAVNAWRNIARVTDRRHQFASLIVAGYHVGGAGRAVIIGSSAKSPLTRDEDPMSLFRGKAEADTPKKLLAEAETAIRSNDQVQAAAAVLRYSQLEQASRPVFDLLLKYAVSEDGRLHAEKYYRTVTEEFATVRPSLRWRELVALARVTASCYGMNRSDQSSGRAPGYEAARQLLDLA